MDVKLAEDRLRAAAAECDEVADAVVSEGRVHLGLSEPGSNGRRDGRPARWLAIAAVLVAVAGLAALIAVRGVGSSEGPSDDVRTGREGPEAGPGWEVLDPASLPYRADAWQVRIEPESAHLGSDGSTEGSWCLWTGHTGGGGGVCGGNWARRDHPRVTVSMVHREWIDPDSELPDPPKGTQLMSVAGPTGVPITIGTGADAIPLDQVPVAGTSTAVVDGVPWTATAFYIRADSSDFYPGANYT